MHSSNVFDVMGFNLIESSSLFLRSRLMSSLINYIKSNDITHLQACDQLGLTQKQLRELLLGKISEFSIDGLITLLSKADFHVMLHCEKVNAQRVFLMEGHVKH